MGRRARLPWTRHPGACDHRCPMNDGQSCGRKNAWVSGRSPKLRRQEGIRPHGERYRPVRPGPLLGLVSGGLLVPVTVACPWIGVIVVLTPLTLLCCVVLPGVWSASPSRRRDARVMVVLLLGSPRRERR